MAVTHIKSNIVPDMTGTVTVAGSNGSSQTIAATDLVRPGDWNSAHGQIITLGGNTAGASLVSGTNVILAGGSNVTLSGIQGANVATISFSAAAGGAGDGGNILAAGTQTAGSTNSVVFANSNGITFGMSNSSQITASHNGLTIARASNDAVGLNSAFTAGPLAATINSSGLSLNASNAAGTTSGFAGASISGSMTHNTAGLNISLNHPAWLTTAAQSNHSHGNPTLALTNLSGTTASNSAGLTLSLSAAAAGAGGTTNQTGPNIGVSNLGNTAGSTGTVSTGNVVLVGSNGITLSQSTGGAGSDATVTIVGNGSTLSDYVLAAMAGKGWMPYAGNYGSLAQNSVFIFPVYIPHHLTCDHIRIPVAISNSSSAAASVQRGHTVDVGIYTRHSTNNTVLTRHYSTSHTMAASHSSNASWMLSIITGIGNSTSYNTLTASSAGINLSASLHGTRELIVPVSSLLTPGEYWFAIRQSSSSAGAAGLVLAVNNWNLNVNIYNPLGVSTGSTNSQFNRFIGLGQYSVTSGALPGGISITQINQTNIAPVMYAATGTA